MPLSQKHPWNVLVFPAASEIGLEIHRSLQSSKEVVLHGAVQRGPSSADFHFKRLHILPSIYEEDCLVKLQALIKAEKIDALFPAHDDVLVWLGKHKASLAATILSSPPETCFICRSKKETYKILSETVDIPKLYEPEDRAIPFPVFVKPDCGQGSQRARVIPDRPTLNLALKSEPDLLVMENLEGNEYTIDCFNSHSGEVLYAGARQRIQTRTGISTRTKTAAHIPALKWAQRIAEKLTLNGTWFFQLKEDREGNLRLLEVAPRIAGSMAFSRAAGPNFPLLNLYEAAGYNLKVHAFNTSMEMGRSLDVCFLYDQPIVALYIDLDDTLIVRDKVNTQLVALLFQCHNQKVPVCLLTKHRGDLKTTLADYRLTDLFDRIEHIPAQSDLNKADFIKEKNAVLIDDSFAERTLAQQNNPTLRCFDATSAVCLLDKRA
ncbi:MAG TPA: carboxylate--amine ligase [Rhodospirillaceae bacterium]|nr:carboxylate--amine ligase [Rhodospirillaceae bacterium]